MTKNSDITNISGEQVTPDCNEQDRFVALNSPGPRLDSLVFVLKDPGYSWHAEGARWTHAWVKQGCQIIPWTSSLTDG